MEAGEFLQMLSGMEQQWEKQAEISFHAMVFSLFLVPETRMESGNQELTRTEGTKKNPHRLKESEAQD